MRRAMGPAGSSITIVGNLALQSGAIYLVQINAAAASFANVTGTATSGGATISAVFAGASFVKQYTILTAAGGVTGSFAPVAVTNLSAFQVTLSEDAHHIFLNLALNPSFTSGALNGNQRAVANAIGSFFDANGSISLAFGTLTTGGLAQVSGETATGAQQTTFDAMTQFMGVLSDTSIDGRGGNFSASAGGASAYAGDRKHTAAERDAYGMFTKAPPVPFEPRWSVWAAAFGGSQTSDGNAALVGSNNTTSRVFGTAVGADYIFSPATTAGFALAGGGTSFAVANGGNGRSDLFQTGAFVRHTVGQAY
ncbi:autotransporter domain-containing protein, partial [Bradyrhizobium sp.]|uniref:autotransporter domain-containing protein n=1 Tax=Bradyrhizobium sp. TaxID=376 RepID=UPI003C50E9CE